MSQFQGKEPFFHRNVLVIELQSPELYDQLAADPELRLALWCRLSDRRVAVDPLAEASLVRWLDARGSLPRFARELAP